MDIILILIFFAVVILFLLSLIFPTWVMKLFKNKLSKREVRMALGIAPFGILLLFGLVTDNSETSKKVTESNPVVVSQEIIQAPQETVAVAPTPETETLKDKIQEKNIVENVDKKDILLPGDEVFLRYDTETTEKIYVADSLETYEILKKSYAIKDNESRWELILEGKVIAVPSGTKVRILDYVDVSGAEKVRILEGEHYPFEGYAPYPLLKRK